MPTLPVATSRNAITVGLSRLASTSGVPPCASWRARYVAASVSWKRLGILFRQSSTVMRAMRALLSYRSIDLLERFGVPGALARSGQPVRAYDGAEVAPRLFEVFVDNNIIELSGVADFVALVVQPALNCVLGILPAAAPPALELRQRRRRRQG